MHQKNISRINLSRNSYVWDKLFYSLSLSAAFLICIIFLGIVSCLFIGSWPALKQFGMNFLLSSAWNPVTENFGAAAPLFGTIFTSMLALLLAAPLGIGIAIFLTELCPFPLRRPLSIAIELLAGIPSIIYGLWGLFILAPILQRSVQPFLISSFSSVPIVKVFFSGPPYGIGVLTAGLILGIMILPFISAIGRDIFESVPAVLKEAAYGVGCTRWEVIRNIVLPYTHVGLIGGSLLGLSRALGETMAVTFVIGNVYRISPSFLGLGTTISAAIANEFTETSTILHSSSLTALALLLFCLTFFVLSGARMLLMYLNWRAKK